MTDEDELRLALEAIASAFDALGVTWAIGGSLASAAHGEPRATNHVDVIAMLDMEDARKLPALLGGDFYVEGDAAAEATRNRSSFNVIDQRSFIKIDVFVPRQGPLGTGQLDRRELLELLPGSRALPVLGPEDVVLQKLNCGGESDQQWRDLVSVLRYTASEIDNTYLDGVAAAEGLAPLLARARQAAHASKPSSH